MRSALALVLGAALCASVAPVALHAAAAAPAKAGAKATSYKAPRNAFGQPDLSGYWSNVSMTYETRPGNVKGAVYTPEQAAAIEQADAKRAIAALRRGLDLGMTHIDTA